MNIIVDVPIIEIETYKDTIKKLNDAFCNCMSWYESKYSINDEDSNNIIIEGEFFRWYDIKKDIMAQIKTTFIIGENKIENVSFNFDVFYENKEGKIKDKDKIISELKDKYDFAIMFMKVTPLKLYRLICVLFAEVLKVNEFLYERDQMDYYPNNFFLQSLRENKNHKIKVESDNDDLRPPIISDEVFYNHYLATRKHSDDWGD